MTALVERTGNPIDAIAIRGINAEGHDSLPIARRLLGDAANAIAREPNRMGAWRMVGALLEARKALKSHGALCNSAYGPLLHITRERPELDWAVQRILDDHASVLASVDETIALATREKASTPESAHALGDAVLRCSAAVEGYERRFHELTFEAVNRDIGAAG